MAPHAVECVDNNIFSHRILALFPGPVSGPHEKVYPMDVVVSSRKLDIFGEGNRFNINPPPPTT